MAGDCVESMPTEAINPPWIVLVMLILLYNQHIIKWVLHGNLWGHRQMDIEKGHQILQNIRWLNPSKGELRCPLFSTLFKQTCFVKTPITLLGSPKIL